MYKLFVNKKVLNMFLRKCVKRQESLNLFIFCLYLSSLEVRPLNRKLIYFQPM